MKQYIQYFTNYGDTDQVWEASGSDGYIPLDGRLSLQSCINIANTHKNFRGYAKWAIMQGDLRFSRVVYKNFTNKIKKD